MIGKIISHNNPSINTCDNLPTYEIDNFDYNYFVQGNYIKHRINSQKEYKPNISSTDSYSLSILKKYNDLKKRKITESFFFLKDYHVFKTYNIEYTSKKILSGHQIGFAPNNIDLEKLKNSQNKNATHTIKTAFVINGRGHNVYGHWLLDILPRIQQIHEYSLNAPIIIFDLKKWKLELLLLFKFNLNRFIFLNYGPILVKELIIPSYPKINHLVNIPLLKRTYARILKPQKPTLKNKLLFISRGKWKNRKKNKNKFNLKNEQELFEIAKRFGFQLLYPENHSIFEQREIFNSARYIIGEDGSALHNIIFCRKGAVCIGLMKPNRTNLWHFAMAEASDTSFIGLKSIDLGNNAYEVNPSLLYNCLKSTLKLAETE